MNKKIMTDRGDGTVYESPVSSLLELTSEGVLCESGLTEMLEDDVNFWNN